MHLEVVVGAVAEKLRASRPEVGEPGDELLGCRGRLLEADSPKRRSWSHRTKLLQSGFFLARVRCWRVIGRSWIVPRRPPQRWNGGQFSAPVGVRVCRASTRLFALEY